MYLEGVYDSIAYVVETGYMLTKLSFASWVQTQQNF